MEVAAVDRYAVIVFGKQIPNILPGPISKIRNGVAEELEYRDAGVVDVVVGPEAMGQPLDMLQSLRAQEGVVLARQQLGFLDDEASVTHYVRSTCSSRSRSQAETSLVRRSCKSRQ